MAANVIRPKIPQGNFLGTEAINVLRGNIQMAGSSKKVIAFTSSQPNEGKSTISFRLAKALANAGKKTLFIDGDIRNSQIKEKYQIKEQTVGLSEYLCDMAGMTDIIYHTDDFNFDCIFSGKVAPNPSELLSDHHFEQLVSILRELYDYIIVDTPPVNVVIDASLIAQKCDATVLVVKQNYTDKRDAVRMKKQLEASGCSFLGVVVNLLDEKGKNPHQYGYGRYDSYQKYEKYGYAKK